MPGAGAFFVHTNYDLAVWALELELPHKLAVLLIQWLEFVFVHLSASHASHIFRLCLKCLLALLAEYFGARTAHYRVKRER